MGNDILVKAVSLSRFYNNHCAVSDLSLCLRRGEVLGLLGPNGVGKSTTMQMLTGNLAPSSGEIVVNGIDLLDEPKAAKTHIGYLPEQPPVYNDLTVNEFLSYCARLHGFSKSDAQQVIAKARQRLSLIHI